MCGQFGRLEKIKIHYKNRKLSEISWPCVCDFSVLKLLVRVLLFCLIWDNPLIVLCNELMQYEQ